MKLIRMASSLLLALSVACSTKAQTRFPAPYCGGRHSFNYNMIDSMKFESANFHFGDPGSWIDTNDYTYFNTTRLPNITAGSTATIKLKMYSAPDAEPIYYGVWIDFNHNNTFETSELFMQNNNTIMGPLPTLGESTSWMTKTFSIPASAYVGTTRMRILRTSDADAIDYSASFTVLPCVDSEEYLLGCTYDFDVIISAATTTATRPVAGFRASAVTGTTATTFTLTDTSLNTPTSWAWAFTPATVTYVGGTSATSRNPQVQFTAAGTYTARLIATNAAGTDTANRAAYFTVSAATAATRPIAGFRASNLFPSTFEVVTLTDTSLNTPTGWTWAFTPATVAFVGGTLATSRNPQVQFTAAGTYTARLIATNAAGSDTANRAAYFTVTAATAATRPVAGFRASAVTGTTATTFTLTDTSLNTPTSWAWAFTPATVTFVGGTSATSRNPQVQFTAAGTYTARLIATNAAGSDTANRAAYFTVTAATAATRPVAGFRASAVTGTTATTFTLTDTSLNTPTSWAWAFTPATVTYVGGTSATSRNPQVQFTAAGTYTARLIATNAAGTDTANRTAYFTVTAATAARPIAGFRASNLFPSIFEPVTLTDTSLNTPTDWEWSFTPATVTFIGGTTSRSQNPQIGFTVPGVYTARLIARNAVGADTANRVAYFNVTPFPRPIAGFRASATSGTTATVITLTDTSLNTPTGWAWAFTPATVTFVGGTSATSRNPQVQFTAAGTYTARLIATNAAGSDTANRAAYFTITAAATAIRPVAGFRASAVAGTTATTFTLTDTSLNTPTGWAWAFTPATVTFVGGTSATSRNPQVQFTAAGTYTARLIATNAAGSDTANRAAYFTITAAATAIRPVAGFRASAVAGTTATTFTLTDTSLNTPTGWAWAFTPATVTFVGGTSATSRNPQVQFTAAGTYTARLIATNAAGSDTANRTAYFTITAAAIRPVAGFRASAVAGTTATTFTLTDTSLNTPTGWAWAFTPATVTFVGGTSATSRNPQVQFTAAGTYTARLIATNAAGSDTANRAAYFNITAAVIRPVAGFRASAVTGTTATTFTLTDTSLNTPTGWAWDFTPATFTFLGGTSATSRNPQVQFTAAGTYTARLIATNAAGSDTANRAAYFTITAAAIRPVAGFRASATIGTTATIFNLFDTSLNIPTTWRWSFLPATVTFVGGTNANSRNPQVVFNVPGLYTAKLVASNTAGSDSLSAINYFNISAVPVLAPKAYFNVNTRTGSTATVFSFTDSSLNVPTSWLWSFTPNTITYQTGTNANSQNPKIKCNATGIYTVKLVVRNAAGADSLVKLSYLNIAPLGIELDNNNRVAVYPNPVANTLYCSDNCLHATVQLFDMNGKNVISIVDLQNNAIDLSNVPNGIYTLKLSGENVNFAQQINIIK